MRKFEKSIDSITSRFQLSLHHERPFITGDEVFKSTLQTRYFEYAYIVCYAAANSRFVYAAAPSSGFMGLI